MLKESFLQLDLEPIKGKEMVVHVWYLANRSPNFGALILLVLEMMTRGHGQKVCSDFR